MAVPSQQLVTRFMKIAIDAAEKGIELNHGGPFGACIAQKDKIIAVSHNTVLKDKDSTCHAEINCIREACKTLRTNDLSDLVLYTSSEPCPMCWGGINRSKIRKVYSAADRNIAKKYGFDDLVFYEKIMDLGTNQYPFRYASGGFISNSVARAFLDKFSRMKWKLMLGNGYLQKLYMTEFNSQDADTQIKTAVGDQQDIKIMYKMIQKMLHSSSTEPYGAIIIKEGQIISECYENMDELDPTASVETIAIRNACKKLGSHNLTGCAMYVTIEPDVLGIGASMWSRIDSLYAAIDRRLAASYGFLHSFLQFKEFECIDRNRLTTLMHCTDFVCMAEEVFRHWQDTVGYVY